MKYVVLLGDGMADEPLAELNGQTPLQAADTPNMDRLARQGALGMVQTIPAGYPPGSDVANLSAFGYDPAVCYTGRSPLEAASMGVELGPDDIAFRLNLVTLGDRDGEVYMDDFSAGHIGSEQAGQLVEALQQEFGGENFSFHPGVSYRHLMVWHGGRDQLSFTPPHDITGQPVAEFLPKGEGAETLQDLANRAKALLETHEVNRERIASGNKPANAIWLWGHGRAPQMETLRQKFGISGAVISAVDLIKGIGVYAGLDVIEVPGATGYLDTDYLAKGRYALESLKTRDYVYVHVEAPDEASHSGDLPEKIRAIESFDELVVGTVLEGLPALGEFRLMVLPDHPTPISKMTHTGDAVPFILFDSRAKDNPNAFAGSAYHEKAAVDTGFFIEHGYELMNRLITGCS
ncbi:cofactor-independent phosphoglycerate mutase [Syntrophotalea acetylenivorans]|uniref:Cofactor-independent phosphoglycerate mutase n=1 Tax=Syntrophotalea acetylenivorans TaxID=1842532 RepID=A0A1L3GSW2_9BACT|nr:cofactor-independent phosphoglycerate mutase [Syntrophotalea acetylenivorans]APG29007.1 cofactor-independent phosphoglycerate mutase [Syntrophotalea acetylenivorans]